MTLYEINKEIESLLDAAWIAAEENDGVIPENLGAMLEKWQTDRDTKISNIVKYIKNLRAEASAIKNEIATLSARKKSKENKEESLKSYLDMMLDGQKWEDSTGKVGWRKSQAVDITDETMLPLEYLIAQKPKVDKAGISKALKASATVPGAKLITKNNISIK